jgi:hypothetical protein
MANLIAELYKSPKTIFTNKDLALFWRENDKNKLNSKIAYYVKQKTLISLARGVFAKIKQYDPKELATSVYIPAYVSFETVLREAGVIFQHYDAIFVASKCSKTIVIDEHAFVFRKLKNTVLYNPAGIVLKGNYSVASPERAFLDMIYLFPSYHFDNLHSIDFQKCFELAAIYANKQLVKRLNKYYKNHAE